MGWSIGWDSNWQRDIGYGVPAYCDHPRCNKEIDRGISFVCGGQPYGGEHGCGLYFCKDHLRYRNVRGEGYVQNCPRCAAYHPPYQKIKPDHPEWTHHKMTDPSWAKWREEQGL